MSRTDPFPFGAPTQPEQVKPSNEPPTAPASGVSPAATPARVVPDEFLSAMEASLGGRPKVGVVETPETHGENGARYAGVGIAVPRERLATEPNANVIVAVPTDTATAPSPTDRVGSSVAQEELKPPPSTHEEYVAGRDARAIQIEAAKRVASLAANVGTVPVRRNEPTRASSREKRRVATAVLLGVALAVFLLVSAVLFLRNRAPRFDPQPLAGPTSASAPTPSVSGPMAPTSSGLTPSLLSSSPSAPTVSAPTVSAKSAGRDPGQVIRPHASSEPGPVTSAAKPIETVPPQSPTVPATPSTTAAPRPTNPEIPPF